MEYLIKLITFTDERGKRVCAIVDNDVYLLNDKGQTIERIN